MKFKKKNKRKLSIGQHLKRWIKPLLLLLVLLVISWNVYQYNPSELLKVSVNWTIDRTHLVGKLSLEKKIEPLANEFYQLDLHDIKHELELHPWVLEAQVKRLFLDAIDINIITHEIAAHWQNIACEQDQSKDNCRGYVTTTGLIITPKNLFYHQQEESSDAIELHSAYDLTKNDSLLNEYQAYQQILTKMKIEKFVKSNIDSLSIKPNITVILGYNQQQQRLENFIKIYTKLRKKVPLKKLNKATYDMRYSKGFTLKYQ